MHLQRHLQFNNIDDLFLMAHSSYSAFQLLTVRIHALPNTMFASNPVAHVVVE